MSDFPPFREGQESPQFSQGPVTYLEPALWQKLSEASTDHEYCLSWLRLQCRLIDDVHQGVVMLGPAEVGPFLSVAAWPETQNPSESFKNLVRRVLRERKGVVTRYQSDYPDDIPDRFHVGYPIKLDDRLYGVIVLDIAHRNPECLQTVMRQLQWGSAWLLNLLLRKRVKPVESSHEQLSLTVDLAALTLQKTGFQSAAMACVTDLASRMQCDRVSIGFLKKDHVEIAALSHSAQFGSKMNLLRDISRAMDECFDQRSPILYPPTDTTKNQVTRAHSELANQYKSMSVLTIPLYEADGNICGALTFERSVGGFFSHEDTELCLAIGALIGPILEEKRLNNRNLYQKLRDEYAELLLKLFGPGHSKTKAFAIILSIIAIFFVFAKGDYRVTSKAFLEGEILRATTVPFDGYIEESLVKAGDVVKEGQLMARLHDKDLGLEQLKWSSLKEQHQLEYYKALANGEQAAAQVYLEQANQASAQLNLIDMQLVRAKITSPFDGLVVSGDLSQSLGAPVARGDVLFEVAPLNSYRVILEVDEHDIGEIVSKQKGALILNSLPSEKLDFQVVKITPVSTTRDGLNFFRVEARLDKPIDRLRPGMEGYGKIEIERRHLIWIWSHELVRWFELWAWKWIP